MQHISIALVALAALASPAEAQGERITWNHRSGSQAITFYDSGSNYTTFHNHIFGTAWRLVGVAGNRILWQEQVNARNATLWRISDSGAYEHHVVLTPPASGYKARSLALATEWVGACFRRQDDQAYWVLWESDTPNTAIYVQLVRGDGSNLEPVRRITKPAAMGTRAAIALTPIHGLDLAVLFAQDAHRASVWTIFRSSMTFGHERVLVANPLPRTSGRVMAPASLNIHWDSAEGAILQILFNDVTNGAFGGAAMVVNVRETSSRPFGRLAFKREIWAHAASLDGEIFTTNDSHEATAHTIQPPVCP